MFFRHFICILAFLLASVSFGQQLSQKPENKRDLIAEGTQALIDKDFYSAIKKLSEAKQIAERDNDYESLWRIQNFLGQSYSNLGVKTKAFQELTNSLDILNEHPSILKYKSIIFNNLGSLFIEDDDFEKALFYIDAGIEILKDYPDDDALKPIFYYLVINKADLHNKMENYDQALEILKSLADFPVHEYPEIETALELTRAQNFYLSGRTTEARKLVTKILEGTTQNNSLYDQILELLAKVDYKEKNYGLAVRYLSRSIQETDDWRLKASRYSMMADIYRDMENSLLQLKYKDSVIFSKDSLAAMVNRGMIENTQAQLDIEKYKYDLMLSHEKQKSQKEMLWIVIISAVLLLAAVFFWQKNRVAKQKQEKIIIRNNEQLARLALEEERKDLLLAHAKLESQKEKDQIRQEKLKNKIAHKNRELASKALFITERNHLLKEVLEKLDSVKEISEDKSIRKFIHTLKNELKAEDEWKDYVQLFEEINPDFFRYLKQHHPSLTDSDLRFLSYVFMNLNLQEIANVMVITLEASKKRKQRIAQKMQISTEELLDYLLQIETGVEGMARQ